MNPCDAVLPILSDYMDGELLPEDAAVVESHLAGCEHCTALVRSLRRNVTLFRGELPGPEPRPLSPDARQFLEEAYRKTLGK